MIYSSLTFTAWVVVARSDQHVMIQGGTAIFVRYIKEACAYINMFPQMNVYYFMASAVCDKCYFIETNVYLKKSQSVVG